MSSQICMATMARMAISTDLQKSHLVCLFKKSEDTGIAFSNLMQQLGLKLCKALQ